MDIITQLGYDYWKLIGNFNPIMQMFLLRWAYILLALLFFGLIVRAMSLILIKHTLTFQALALVLGINIGLSIRVENAMNLDYDDLNILLTIAILSWIALPFILPTLLIRRRGLQLIACPIIFTLEIILLIIQLTVLKGD